MPFQSGTDTVLQVQLMRDVDGVYRVKFDGERLTEVSGAMLSAADKRAISQSLTSRFYHNGLMVLIQGSTNGAGPVQDTLANLAEA